MALEFLDDAEIRPNFRVKVEKATFEQKGQEYVPKREIKVDEVEKMRIRADIEK